MVETPIEEVPIDPEQLEASKRALADSDKISNESSQLGVSLAKLVAQTAQKGQESEEAERTIQASLRQIIVSLAIKPDEFRGFDFDKGIVKIQRAPTEEAPKEAVDDTSVAGPGTD